MEVEPAITLRIPAVASHAVLVRVAAAAVCARLDFPIDRIEDVKLAVDESVALLLRDAVPDGHVEARFTPDPPDGLRVVIDVETRHGRSPDRTSFTWTVLAALVDDVTVTVSADRHLRIELAVHRAEAIRP